MTQLPHDLPPVAATVAVELGQRAYSIRIGRGLIRNAKHELNRMLPGCRYAIVADEAVKHVAKALESRLDHGDLLGSPMYIPSGESSKSFEVLHRVCDGLLALGIERAHAVIAVGGGVTGDLAGFAAAIVKRGVRIVQVPTTLLAQVDSSVGGKTGINSPQGKNLIGAFHQPSLVLIDFETLDTLPLREFRSGYAEIVKYGVLGNAAFFAWLEDNRDGVFSKNDRALTHAAQTSCEMKAGIVARDEFESGERALLNLGHTFGHAVEAWAGYSGDVLHGEAVALGMILASEFSALQGFCPESLPDRLRDHLAACGFVTSLTELASELGRGPHPDELLAFMLQDKKVEAGALTLVLLRGIGEAFVARRVPTEDVAAFLRDRI